MSTPSISLQPSTSYVLTSDLEILQETAAENFMKSNFQESLRGFKEAYAGMQHLKNTRSIEVYKCFLDIAISELCLGDDASAEEKFALIAELSEETECADSKYLQGMVNLSYTLIAFRKKNDYVQLLQKTSEFFSELEKDPPAEFIAHFIHTILKNDEDFVHFVDQLKEAFALKNAGKDFIQMFD